jgi:hypothetical protein
VSHHIIARLPTKDAARTQALARSWRPLWRSAPLNIHVDYGLSGKDESERRSIVSKILADHLAPARRFYFNATLRHECQHSYMEEEHAEDHADQIQSWFCSQALDNLEEVDINLGILYYYDFTDFLQLPPAMIRRCASTIVVAKFSVCDFRKEMAPWPSFPFLKQLTLQHVYIHKDAFLGMLSSCHALESLYVSDLYDVNCLRISSHILRSLGIGYLSNIKLVIEDTPFLERLLLSGPRDKLVIHVIKAQRLEILGPLSCFSRIEIESLVSQVILSN